MLISTGDIFSKPPLVAPAEDAELFVGVLPLVPELLDPHPKNRTEKMTIRYFIVPPMKTRYHLFSIASQDPVRRDEKGANFLNFVKDMSLLKIFTKRKTPKRSQILKAWQIQFKKSLFEAFFGKKISTFENLFICLLSGPS